MHCERGWISAASISNAQNARQTLHCWYLYTVVHLSACVSVVFLLSHYYHVARAGKLQYGEIPDLEKLLSDDADASEARVHVLRSPHMTHNSGSRLIPTASSAMP